MHVHAGLHAAPAARCSLTRIEMDFEEDTAQLEEWLEQYENRTREDQAACNDLQRQVRECADPKHCSALLAAAPRARRCAGRKRLTRSAACANTCCV